jgi:hypothetical protein
MSLQRVGYVAQIGNTRIAYGIMKGKPHGKWSHERPRDEKITLRYNLKQQTPWMKGGQS